MSFYSAGCSSFGLKDLPSTWRHVWVMKAQVLGILKYPDFQTSIFIWRCMLCSCSMQKYFPSHYLSCLSCTVSCARQQPQQGMQLPVEFELYDTAYYLTLMHVQISTYNDSCISYHDTAYQYIACGIMWIYHITSYGNHQYIHQTPFYNPFKFCFLQPPLSLKEGVIT